MYKKGNYSINMIRCYKSQFTVGLRTQLYADNFADRIRQQIFSNPNGQTSFFCKTKRIFMNIKCCLFFDTHTGFGRY